MRKEWYLHNLPGRILTQGNLPSPLHWEITWNKGTGSGGLSIEGSPFTAARQGGS